jgi:tRNA (guanine6-N2)-methyltransferase
MLRYWLRTIRGLEWVAAAEAASIAERPRIALGHRSVFLECDHALKPDAIRCSDDLFRFWAQLSNLDHTRHTLTRLSAIVSALPPVPADIPEFQCLHVTASFTGRRNYLRSEIEQAFGESLAPALGLSWNNQMSQASRTLRIRIHLAGDSALLGVGLTESPVHRRSWRVHTLPGMLHPPVAASIAFLSELREGLTVHDPFAGSGTILIESGLRCPGLHLTGGDVNPDAIKIARDHANKAGVAVDLQVRDAFATRDKLPKAHRVLSNPPWGVSVTSAGPHGSNPLNALINLLSPDGLLVAITDRSMQVASLCERAGLNPDIIFPVRIAGRMADIVVADRSSRGLANPLKEYWKAMETILWQGDEGRGTIDVPQGWPEPIRAACPSSLG